MAHIGIDLGTTHSLVALVIDGKARALLDDDGRALLPSAVRYGPDGPEAIGWDALSQATEHAETTLTSVKRLMGRGLEEAREEAGQLPFQLAEGDDKVVRIQVGERTLTPIEVSADILRMLKNRATECLFTEPTGAVITVPAYFDDAQRQATRDAARVAGLEVLRLLNEPTAAAIAYGLEQHQTGRYAIYDLGGGTFDISILSLTDGVFQVLSTAGDTHLGGDDFDRILADQLLGQAGQTGAGGSVLRAALTAAEAAKRVLSREDAAEIDVDLGGTRVQRTLTRADFEALIGDLVDRTLARCAQALEDASLATGDVDGVVLVGGSTRVPLVRERVGAFFDSEPHCDLDPDRVVALGAALQADILTGESELAEDLLLLDVLPLSLGLETMGGVVERLLFRCSPIPASASETFTTHVDGQSAVALHVVQGERELVAHNRSLARFDLTGIPPMPAGLPRIKVDFTVDASGILTVTATETYTGTEATCEVQPSYGLEESEIERMLEEAIDRAESDVDERMLIEARVEGEQVALALSGALAADAALLVGNEAQVLGAVLDELRKAMEGTERKRISDLTHKLDEASAPFAQRRIERDLQIALQGRSTDEVAERLELD